MENLLNLILEDLNVDIKFKNQLQKAVDYLNTKNKVLLLTTSNRGDLSSKDGSDSPKSTRIAEVMQRTLGGDKCTLIDISKLKIYSCEGNVSSKDGNTCGVKASALKNSKKNPTGDLRCWASYNNPDDELWKIVTPLLESEVVVFMGSIRWGQTNAIYQKLIERLNWIENRHTTLGEKNIVKNIESGFIFIGQNWNGSQVVKVQKKVHEFYGFKPADALYFNWQYTQDILDESKASYKEAVTALDNIINNRTLNK
jgi:multimeric flavodoxin WrbA